MPHFQQSVFPSMELSDSPLLLTPGPLTTSAETRAAMNRDWGSRDEAFIALTARIRRRLSLIAGGTPESHPCVPIQGSGTFAVEAMIGSLIPRDGKVLVLENGAYGRRIGEICRILDRPFVMLSGPETKPTDLDAFGDRLAEDPAITDIVLVHCETTTGVLNPLDDVAAMAESAGKRLLIDAMSSFGALPISFRDTRMTALAASSNKCLEGVPGIGFVIGEKDAFARGTDFAASLSLDLCAQLKGFEVNGQWRFTPPTHVIAALDKALDQFDAEGGLEGRGGRYADNCHRLTAGLDRLGLKTVVDPNAQAPIIVTVAAPQSPAYDFGALYDALLGRGYAIYPGKLTEQDSFRIGCIGAIDGPAMDQFLAALEAVMKELGLIR